MTAEAINAGSFAGQPNGPKPKSLSWGRIGLYAFLVIAALFFLVPLYVMIVTSLKSMPEVREAHIFNLPREPTIQPWIDAMSTPAPGATARASRRASGTRGRSRCRRWWCRSSSPRSTAMR